MSASLPKRPNWYLVTNDAMGQKQTLAEAKHNWSGPQRLSVYQDDMEGVPVSTILSFSLQDDFCDKFWFAWEEALLILAGMFEKQASSKRQVAARTEERK